MSKKLDWFYHRKNCISCTRAQTFLEQHDLEPATRTDARKERPDRAEALALAKAADKIVVAKGKKVVTFDMKRTPPDDDTLAAHLLGPTGNLRAPTIRRGRTLLIGFNEEAYADHLT